MTRAKGKKASGMAQDSTPTNLREGADGGDSSAVKTAFFNAQDGLKGRDGGPYLDHIERQDAEVTRAFREGRKPVDLNGPLPAATGTLMVVAAQVEDNPYSNPSMLAAPGINSLLTQEDIQGNKDFADPISVLPVDQRTDAPAEDEAEIEVTTSQTGLRSTTEAGSVSDPKSASEDKK